MFETLSPDLFTTTFAFHLKLKLMDTFEWELFGRTGSKAEFLLGLG
jgi:hypothetical protein